MHQSHAMWSFSQVYLRMICLGVGDPLKAVLDDGARDDLVVPSAGATRIARSFRTQVSCEDVMAPL